MLHLRVISPPDRTDAVRALLVEDAGATHVTVLPGIAVQPAGDVVEADVAREAADGLLAALCRMGLDHDGGITLEAIDTALSDRADRAEEESPGDPIDAIIWDDLIARTGEDSRFSLSFQVFLTISCVLAAIGVVTDSAVTVMGAMVMGPEFGPLAAMAVGMVLRRGDLVRRGAYALGVGFPLAMLVTFGATVLFDLTGLLRADALASLEQVDFIYQVGPFSVIVAVLAGAAGMVALTSARSASLVGVFISITTVPAAAYAAVALVEGRWGEALLSFVQLVVNVVSVVAAAALVLVATRRSRHNRQDRGCRLSTG